MRAKMFSGECSSGAWGGEKKGHGKLYDCSFIGVVEKDSRHGAAVFGKEKDRAPADLKHLLDEVEYIEYCRRDFEARAMVVAST